MTFSVLQIIVKLLLIFSLTNKGLLLKKTRHNFVEGNRSELHLFSCFPGPTPVISWQVGTGLTEQNFKF